MPLTPGIEKAGRYMGGAQGGHTRLNTRFQTTRATSSVKKIRLKEFLTKNWYFDEGPSPVRVPTATTMHIGGLP